MKEINPAIEDMKAHSKLSERKIERLIFIKKLIDRISTRPYLPESEVTKIEKKFGVKPDVITWGDYFQTHIASEHWEKSDDEFDTIINTVHFDLVASVMIFANKSEKFFDDVESAFQNLNLDISSDGLDDEEINHLHILMTYYNQMGLKMSAYNISDFEFFREYAEDKAVS